MGDAPRQGHRFLGRLKENLVEHCGSRPMYRTSTVLLFVLLVAGCGRAPVPQAPIKGDPKEPLVELRIGDDQDEARNLSFKITAVHEKQTRSKIAPYYVNGGDWVFFDCQARSDPNVVFTVGIV